MKNIKLLALTGLVILLGSFTSLAQSSNQVNKGGNLTQAEIGSGIKEALENGVAAGADRLAAKDGFFGNPTVKILFPPEAHTVESTLRNIGLNQLCDNVILSINRAAEDAAQEAKPIFMSALKEMSLDDATNILLSEEPDAATTYFNRVTSEQLQAKFKPIIQASLEKSGATAYWKEAIGSYNKVPLIKNVNPDLTDYVTQRAVEGLFVQISVEEQKIRQDAGARTSPLLQKVFGYAQKNN